MKTEPRSPRAVICGNLHGMLTPLGKYPGESLRTTQHLSKQFQRFIYEPANGFYIGEKSGKMGLCI